MIFGRAGSRRYPSTDPLRSRRHVACHHLELKGFLGLVVVDCIMEASAFFIFFSVDSKAPPTSRCRIMEAWAVLIFFRVGCTATPTSGYRISSSSKDHLRSGRRVASYHLELKDVLGLVVVDCIMEALAGFIRGLGFLRDSSERDDIDSFHLVV